VFLYIPAGPPVDRVLDDLAAHLEAGDILIDGGNSYWGDSIRRHRRLKEKQVKQSVHTLNDRNANPHSRKDIEMMKKDAMLMLVAMSLSFVAIPASSQVIPPAPGKEIHSPQQVERAQQALRDKGQDPGPIDGIMGPRTKAAVKNFQREEGLRETGRLDSETMTKLGVEAAPGEVPREKPQATPGSPPPQKPY